MLLSALTLLLVHAASLSTPSVPGAGRQEALLTLDAPGAVHLSARSPSGTACTIIDRVRGPFAQAGAVGGANCELDLLLDAGQYKVRVESPRRGKGLVALTATGFQELNQPPPRLIPGASVTTTLKPQQQASYWLSLKERGVPWVRIAGRHAGDVRLWRNGEWLEPKQPWHQQFAPRPGQPLHEWWLDEALEAGDYTLVVYGRDSTTVTGSSVDDTLTIEAGFLTGPAEQSVAFTLPPSGVFAVQVPSMDLAGLVTLEAPPASAVELQALRGAVRSPVASCRIDKGALVPECRVAAGGRQTMNVLLVRGAPGTRGSLEWQTFVKDASGFSSGGYYGPGTNHLRFRARKGAALVSVHDFPADTDGAPLGCIVGRVNASGEVQGIVAQDVIALGDGEKLERDFNYADGASLWFELKGGGLLQRAGLAARKVRITTSGGRKSTCEVYRVKRDGTVERLTQSKAEGGACNELLALDAGLYQLQLSGGLSGIESLRIAPEGDASARAVSARGSCTLPSVALEDATYEVTLNRLGAVRIRGLMLEALPARLVKPLHVTLDARRSLELPIALTSGALVRSGGPTFGCALRNGAVNARAGECALPAGDDVLTLSNPSDQPLSLTLLRPGTLPAPASLVSWAPVLAPLPRVTPGTPTFFDFDRGQTHSVLFDVEAPGLYHVTTEGLLATECRLRTPVVDTVSRDQGGGRGRNCLVQTYLQKGRYLFSATTAGKSRGRGAVTLTQRPAKPFAGIVGEGEQYFRVDANELVQQRLTVKADGAYELGTTSQGTSSMPCRLDDPDGWPVEAVPSACVGRRELRAGTYLWTQLPLTVESMRRTQLQRVREAVTLKGNTPHALDFFSWYTAELGADGKDEFLFTLEGDTQLDVVLTAGVQGRVFVLEKDKAPRAVEVVPPMQPADDGEGYEAESPEAEAESAEESAAPEDEGSAYEGDASEDGEGAPPAAQVHVAQARAAPPPPSGVKLTLPAGRYKLVTEHSRGDVGVTYQLHLGVTTMLPGMARSLPVPSTLPLLIPRDGTLRLRTEGEVDVRCRLLDDKGRLVLEGSENGSDWNCAIAEPVKRGRYTLLLESETQRPGETRLSVALPAVEDKGRFTDGARLTLGEAVVSLALPPTEQDAVLEVSAKAQGGALLSCALAAADGAVVHRKSRVGDCTLLLRPRKQAFTVRLWTTDGSAAVQTSLRALPVTSGGAGVVPADGALAVRLPRAGRYRTSAPIACIGADEAGLLRPCGPEVSLEAGITVFAAAGGKPQALSLDELVVAADEAPLTLGLGRIPFVQQVKARQRSLFLLDARVQHGERAAPMCAFDGVGAVRERRDTACFAVSAASVEATARLWAASERDVEARVVRRAVALPEQAEALSPGRRRLAFSNVGRFALPKDTRVRLEVTLPQDAWAVQLDDAGAALDLCAPTTDLRRCVLTGQGGSVLVIASDGSADVTTLRLEGAATSVVFTGLYEDAPRAPGTLRLAVPAAENERAATIDGALRCTIALEDGTRLSSCKARLPARASAELIIEHDAGPLRAMVHAPGQERVARLGLERPATPGPALAASVAVPLLGGRIDRTLTLAQEAVVRVAADSGVCGLFKGDELLAVDGLDAGCEVVRVLPAGTYRVLARPFAGRALPGAIRWTAEPVTQLTEGVGPEAWLAAGEVRLFRFDAANKGRVGLGVQARSELLDCAVYSEAHQLLGEGCHQYLSLEKGRYLLTVRNAASADAAPLAFKPVVLGLSGERNDVPDEVLQEFFGRVGVSQ